MHFCLALFVVLVWGINFVAVRIALDSLPPLFLVAVRFFLTSLPAIFFVKRPPISFAKIALYGLVMFVLQFGMLFVGMYLGVAPGLASLILQIQVLFTILLGIIFLNEKPHIWNFLGCVISFIGLTVVAMHIHGNISFAGFLFLIGAALFWSLGNLVAKKIGKVNALSLVIWSSLVSWPPLLALSLAIEGPDLLMHAITHTSLHSFLAALYITYGSTLVGYGLWSYLVHHIPLSTIGSFTILIPIIAILTSVLYLHEPLQPWKILAAFLVILGLSINLLGQKVVKLFLKRKVS